MTTQAIRVEIELVVLEVGEGLAPKTALEGSLVFRVEPTCLFDALVTLQGERQLSLPLERVTLLSEVQQGLHLFQVAAWTGRIFLRVTINRGGTNSQGQSKAADLCEESQDQACRIGLAVAH